MKHSSPLPAHPPLLAKYLATTPAPSWQQFRGEERHAYDELCSKLNTRQRGLCAFCELDLVTSVGTRAREVEHWRPKSLDVSPSIVWAFGIGNLQLGCFGGSYPHPAADVDRTGDPPPGPNLSCGSLKGNSDPNNGVNGTPPYRPRDLPESPAMFSVDDDGALRPVSDCAAFGIDVGRLWATIDFLGLNCTRLRNARLAIRQELDAVLLDYIDAAPGADDDARFDAAFLQLVQETAPPPASDLPRFVTTIRYFFGRPFDNVLFPAPDWSTGT